jgi:DNA topoisomerase I
MSIVADNIPREQPMLPRGLHYVSDESPGIRRLRRGKHFYYRQADGLRLSDAQELERIQKLAIPPAYNAVWICPSPRGHIQATGRDARERKQYIYHPAWRQARDETKFDRMADFGKALPRIRGHVVRDLDAAGTEVTRQSVVAAIVHLLDTTLVRVGSDEYARSNGSFGLTTLRKRHVAVKGHRIRLHFRGKSGIAHEVNLLDRRIARVVKRCQTFPGQELFQYIDDAGTAHSIGSTEVNDYLRAASGGEFTAKDFRTWHGSVYALHLWREICEDGLPVEKQDKKRDQPAVVANQLLAMVAKRLGNTIAVCRKSYVHPSVLALLTSPATEKWLHTTKPPARKAGLTVDERKFLAFLSASA